MSLKKFLEDRNEGLPLLVKESVRQAVSERPGALSDVVKRTPSQFSILVFFLHFLSN